MKIKAIRVFNRFIGRVLLKVFNVYMGKLTFKEIDQMAKFFGNVGYFLAFGPKKVIRDNFAIAFPDMPHEDREALMKRFFYIFSVESFELLHFFKNPERFDTNITIEGLEHLDEALQQKNGVIAISAHFDNFPLLMAKLTRLGYSVNVVARPLRDQESSDYIQNMRTAVGIKTIFSYPRRECVTQIIKSLRENQIVLMLVDQNFGGDGGVWIEFFGKLAATPTGAAVFASRTSAAVIPLYIVRTDLGRYTIYIEKMVPLERYANQQQEQLVNTARYSQIIERWIRRYPAHWAWIHKRWKSRPNREARTKPHRIYPEQKIKEVSHG